MAASKSPRTGTKPKAKNVEPKKRTVSAKRPSTTRKRPVDRKITAKSAPSWAGFKLTAEERPFMQISFTKDTLYWLIVAVLVVGIGIWVTNIQIQVQNIYDQIEQNNAAYDAAADAQLRLAREKAPTQ